MKTIIALSTVLCVGSSGIHSNYEDVSLEFLDAGLPEIAQEVWRGHGVVRRHLFFLQMHAQHLFGPLAAQLADPIAFVLLAIVLAAGFKLWSKTSDPGRWWYKDGKGVVRGPFSTLWMKHWRATGYLPDDLEIKYAANATFAPLRELFPEPAVPFQSPPTPPGTRLQTVSLNEALEVFQEEASADMLHAQHEAFEKRAQDLEDEMIMTLEAELEESVQSDDGGQPAVSKLKNKESWSSSSKPQVVDEEELTQIRAWRAKRQLHRKEMAQLQIQMSRYNADKTMCRHSSKDKENAMKRNSSEERIQKQFNAWCCNELMSEHQAALDESLSSLIESW